MADPTKRKPAPLPIRVLYRALDFWFYTVRGRAPAKKLGHVAPSWASNWHSLTYWSSTWREHDNVRIRWARTAPSWLTLGYGRFSLMLRLRPWKEMQELEAFRMDTYRALRSHDFEHWCSSCYAYDDIHTPEEKRRSAVRRTVTLDWEKETGDYGEVLSSYPVFQAAPECPGAYVEDPELVDEVNAYNEERRKEAEANGWAMYPSKSAPMKHVPTYCPFHPEYDGDLMYNTEVDAIMAMSRERHAVARLLGVGNRASDDPDTIRKRIKEALL